MELSELMLELDVPSSVLDDELLVISLVLEEDFEDLEDQELKLDEDKDEDDEENDDKLDLLLNELKDEDFELFEED